MTEANTDFDTMCRDMRALLDRQAILDCVNGYNRGLDRLDGELIRQAYHDDGVDEHGPFVGTADEFVKFALEIEASFEATHHGITSHNCQIDGETAHAESYVYFVVTHGDKEVIGMGFGRYIDRLERRDGRWAIVVRRLLMDATFEVARSRFLGDAWDKACGRRDHADLSYQRPLARP